MKLGRVTVKRSRAPERLDGKLALQKDPENSHPDVATGPSRTTVTCTHPCVHCGTALEEAK